MDIIKIKSILKTKKMTYEELSEKSGVPIGTLKSIFSGRTPHPRTDTMTAILEALDIKAEPASSSNILLDKISTLSDEEVSKALSYLDFIISQRK